MAKILYFVPLIFFLVSCESREIKDAKTFIELKDWENAIEKLENEIKNNPKNIEAYKLILKSKFNLSCPEYDQRKFLDPFTSEAENFPSINENDATEIFSIMSKINRLDPNALEGNYIFFKALYYFYKWGYLIDSILESETDMSKRLELSNELFNKRFENDIFNQAMDEFSECEKTNSDLSDNSYLWWYNNTCDTTITIDSLIQIFRTNYPQTDLVQRIDFLEFENNLIRIVDNFRDSPDSGKASDALLISSKFLEKYPDFEDTKDRIQHLLVYYIVANNRDYVSCDEGYRYSNETGLINYLEEISNTDLFDELNALALENIAEYWENKKDYARQIELFEKMLTYNIPDDKKDEIYKKIGGIEKDKENYPKAIKYFELIRTIDDFAKCDLWSCYYKTGNFSKADELKYELELSDEFLIKRLIEITIKLNEFSKIKISDLSVEFDSYSIKLTGIINNNLGRTIHNVKVIGTISDENNNNTKQNYDYIDVIYDGKKSHFEISFYCGSGLNSPSAIYHNGIRYGVRISDYD